MIADTKRFPSRIDNPGMIGITQPRRVAAISMASRVATELNLPPSRVSYQIRYDATTSPDTSVKFMTDGVLLREVAGDLLLGRYSAIVVDEAHERSINTDVLIGVLSRVVRLREEMWREGKEGVKVGSSLSTSIHGSDQAGGFASLFGSSSCPPLFVSPTSPKTHCFSNLHLPSSTSRHVNIQSRSTLAGVRNPTI
jgi:hypothetical protein